LANKEKEIAETPLMRQYNQIKAKHPDALLLFRVGDFYETFGEDAVKASKILGHHFDETKKWISSHIELAGFPHHSLESYLPKLVKAGQRVAICDQLEDPKMTKTIVKARELPNWLHRELPLTIRYYNTNKTTFWLRFISEKIRPASHFWISQPVNF
jgi:DNA mismatch repair ATPase MutS